MGKPRFNNCKLSCQGSTVGKACMVPGYRLRGGSAAPPLLPPGLSLPTTEPSLLKAPSSDPQAEVATGAKRTLPPPPAATTTGLPMLSQVFPSRDWISAQTGMCSQDVNSNLPSALTELSSSLSDNIPKFQKSRADSLIRLQDKGLA